jgi:hypothetical protein
MDGWAMDGFIDIRFALISLNFELVKIGGIKNIDNSQHRGAGKKARW